MKYIAKLYTLVAVTCLLAGCSNDEDVGDMSNPVAVRFGMGEISRLKTTSGGDQWVLDDPIGIFMVKNRQQLNSDNIAEDADNLKYKAQTGGNAISGFTPVGGIPTFYPQNGDNVDFIAYYPYNSQLVDYTYPVDVSNQSNPATIDVLYANSANTLSSGYNKHSGMVDLQFNHALSKLSFALVPGDGISSLTGAKIEITSLASIADMSLADGTVTATNSGQTITANTAADGLSSSAIVIPQNLSGSKIIVTLADNASKFEWTFTNAQFEEGKNHQYSITVSKTGIKVSSDDITIWTGTGDPATTGTAKQLTRYKVGDYYPDPSVIYQNETLISGTAAIGVVFWLDPNAPGYKFDSLGTPTGYFGKIVSLDVKSVYNWGPLVDEQASGVVGIRNSSDGYLGTFNLISKRKEQSDFSTQYQAFHWIYQKNNNDVNGIWYMPAIDELGTLSIIHGTINPKITNAGGVGLFYPIYSSTESDSYNAYVGLINGATENSFKLSSSAINVRAIAKF